MLARGEFSDRRRSRDRRRRPTPMISRFAVLGGRRRASQRRGDTGAVFVDEHGSWLFVLVTAIATLNILDALFTILFLSYGGRELNPIVQLTLDGGLWWFLAVKSIGIGACLVFLTMTKNFLFSRVGLGVIFVGYMALLGWHAYLYTGLP